MIKVSSAPLWVGLTVIKVRKTRSLGPKTAITTESVKSGRKTVRTVINSSDRKSRKGAKTGIKVTESDSFDESNGD